MKQNNINMKESLTSELKKVLQKLGENIRIARKRRRWTMQEMSSRIFVSRQTLSRLERGDSGVTLSVLVSALWVLGLEKELLKLADPEQDKIGIFHERQQLPERVRKQSIISKLDF